MRHDTVSARKAGLYSLGVCMSEVIERDRRYEPEFVDIADDSPEAMFGLLSSRGLGDGLPVVAPTRERVEAMLQFATGDADEVLFTLQPRSGIVTRRVVAINAVMAGCPPEVFPVVLTALRALARPVPAPALGAGFAARRQTQPGAAV